MSRNSVLLSTSSVYEILNQKRRDENTLPGKIVTLMRSSLFYFDVESLVQPTLLSNQTGTFRLAAKLTAEQAHKLAMGRDVSMKPPRYNFRVIVRTCRIVDIVSYSLDCYSCISAVTVNKACLTQLSNLGRGPLDVTEYVKFSPLVENTFFIDRKVATHSLLVAVYLVNTPTSDEIVKRLVGNPSKLLKPNQTSSRMCWSGSHDPDEAVLSAEYSLLCPLTMKRFKVPARGENCQHLSCFDAKSYVEHGLTKSMKWLCPICHSYLHPRDLVIDGFLLEVLRKLESENDSTTKILMSPDGKWKTAPGNTQLNSGEVIEIDDAVLPWPVPPVEIKSEPSL